MNGVTESDHLEGGAVALPAFNELWLLLAGILVLGLIATLVMARGQPAQSLVKTLENERT